MVAHTAASRSALKAQGGLYSAMDIEALTYYIEVPVPSDRTAMLSVHGKRGSKQVLVSQMWYTPPATTLAGAMSQIYGPRPTDAAAETPSVAAVSVSGHATPVVGTGTSGYNGTTNFAGILLPANQVQVSQPMGLALRQDGAILFADSGNNLIRAYVPVYNHVVDEDGLVDGSGTPQGGFNQDNLPANKTELAQPRAVSATGQAVAMFVVADTATGRVRMLGPSALHGAASPSSLAPDGPSAEPTPTAAAARP